jgi:hypothetical protein
VSVILETAIVEAIGPLVDGRAYPNTFPQDPALPIWPAIRYTIVTAEPVEDLSGGDGDGVVETANVRVQFDLVAEDYFSVRALRSGFKNAMANFDPPAVWASEFNTYDTETKSHRVVIDYAFYPSSDPT